MSVTQKATGAPTDGDAPGLAASVRSGVVWSALNTLAMRFGNIAIMVVVVRLVTPEEFGVFAAALTIAVILGSFADWGVSAFLMRSQADPGEVAPTVAFIAIVSGLVLAGATVLAAPLLASMFAAPAAAGPIRVMALCLVIGSLSAVPSALLAREFRQDRLFLANAIAFVPSNAVLLVMAWQGAGAMAFAWSRVVMVACLGVAVTVAVGRWYRPRLDRARLRQVLSFGLPLAGANLVNYTLLNADFAFVGHALGPARLGIYVLAFNVAGWATSILAAAINNVAMPAFSRVGEDPGALRAALHRSTRAVGLVGLPVACLTLVLAEPLVLTLYGEPWRAAIPVLEVLGLYGAVFVVVSLLSNLLVGTGHTTRVFLIQVAWLGVLVPAMLVGIHWQGVTGVAWAHVLVVVVLVLPLYLAMLSRQASGVHRVVARAVAPVLLACLAAGAAAGAVRYAFDIPPVQLLLGGVVGGVVYVACTWRLAAPFLKRGS
jgi:lipopolysaccharide exporter